MSYSNYDVAVAFWDRRPRTGTNMHSTGDKLYSYNTVILQRISYDNKHYTIGNFTYYSASTTRHQFKARVRKATYYVMGVPIGRQDLTHFKKMVWEPGRNRKRKENTND